MIAHFSAAAAVLLLLLLLPQLLLPQLLPLLLLQLLPLLLLLLLLRRPPRSGRWSRTLRRSSALSSRRALLAVTWPWARFELSSVASGHVAVVSLEPTAPEGSASR